MFHHWPVNISGIGVCSMGSVGVFRDCFPVDLIEFMFLDKWFWFRMCILIYLILAQQGTFTIEQPSTSLLFRHPRFQALISKIHASGQVLKWSSPKGLIRISDVAFWNPSYIQPRYGKWSFGWNFLDLKHPNEVSFGEILQRSGDSRLATYELDAKMLRVCWYGSIGMLLEGHGSLGGKNNYENLRCLKCKFEILCVWSAPQL